VPAATATEISNIRISPADGMTQIFIPAGTLKMGGIDVFAEADELPAHDVELDAFWMDQVEVTNGMYGLCVQAGVCAPPTKANSDNRPDYFGNLEFQDYPAVYITWSAAKNYCEWTGRRLPTEAEWERAARGDSVNTYPWGGEIPNETLSNSNNDLGDTSRVGSYAAGASPFGVLDMTGNVWEWVADYYDKNYYAESPGANPAGPESQPFALYRVIRGGSFQDGQRDSRLSNRGYEVGPDPNAIPNTAEYAGNSSSRVGFRCAEDD
jgi:formylglycine-generating enzyme required for sulfatase activity